MKLFVWRDFRRDYTPGIAFAMANTEAQARKIIWTEHVRRGDAWAKEIVAKELDRPADDVFAGPSGGYVCGGG